MSQERPLSAAVDGAGLRVGLVASRFNAAIVDRLLAGACEALDAAGVGEEERRVVRVPGAWEIPVALEALARTGEWDLLVALGAVIRGETAHFEYIAGECSRGAMQVALKHTIPVGFGVLTCDDAGQAEARSGGSAGNMGTEAVNAAIETLRAIGRSGR